MTVCPRPGLPGADAQHFVLESFAQEIDLQDPEEILPVKFQRVGIQDPVDIAAAVHMPVHVNIRVTDLDGKRLLSLLVTRQFLRIPAEHGLAIQARQTGQQGIQTLRPLGGGVQHQPGAGPRRKRGLRFIDHLEIPHRKQRFRGARPGPQAHHATPFRRTPHLDAETRQDPKLALVAQVLEPDAQSLGVIPCRFQEMSTETCARGPTREIHVIRPDLQWLGPNRSVGRNRIHAAFSLEDPDQ